MIDEASPTRKALEALIEAVGEDEARQILAEIARPAAVAVFERLAALRYALRLREAREPRYVIRDRLVRRGVSRSAAYRLITRAIEVPMPNCPSNGPALGREPTTVPTAADLPASPDSHRQEDPMTILVQITALRAPWPEGAGIGAIVELAADEIPALFVGKCKAAEPGAKAAHRWEPAKALDPSQSAGLEGIDELAASTGNVEFLTTRRDELRTRMAAVDLPAARQRLEETRAAAQASPGDVPPVAVPGVVPELSDRTKRHDAAAQAFKAAQGKLRALEAEERELRSELAYVEGLLSAEAQVDTARAVAREADSQAAARRDAAAAADAAVRQIATLIADAEHAYEADRDAAAAKVLEAIKAGSAGGAVKGPSRDKIATLEVAKQNAEQEQQAAHTALKQAEQRRRDAWQQVRLAEAVVAERAFRQVERDYIDALVRVLAAKSIARDPFGPIDPRSEAIDRARRLAERMGA